MKTPFFVRRRDLVFAGEQILCEKLLLVVSAAAEVDNILLGKIGGIGSIKIMRCHDKLYPAHFAAVFQHLYIAAVAVKVEHVRVHMQ